MTRSGRKAALITSARYSRSLDTGQRRTRYLWTMAVRIGCFVTACLVEGWLRWAAFLAAAILPTIAVLLANVMDRRSTPEPAPEPGPARPQLTGPGTIPGQLDVSE